MKDETTKRLTIATRPWEIHDTDVALEIHPQGDSDGLVIIADVHGGDTPQGKVNAHQISAAPELLDACKLADELITDAKCIQSVKWTVARNAIRAAIAKAEGTAK